MILHDVSHTSHSYANSGIQRVVRKIQANLSLKSELKPICFDPYAGYWRELDAGELRPVSTNPDTSYKGGHFNHWSRIQKAKGRVRRYFSSELKARRCADAAFLTAEIFRPSVYSAYSGLFSKLAGPKVAIFVVSRQSPGWVLHSFHDCRTQHIPTD